MYYILYIDRLMLLNFTMNFLTLSLMKQFLGRTATRFRMVIGAAVGAAGVIGVLFIPKLPYLCKTVIGFAAVSVLMVWLMYPKGTFRFYVKALTSLYTFSFLLGGALLFFRKFIKPDGEHLMLSVLLPAVFCYFFLGFFLKKRREVQNECEVLLFFEGKQVKITAFVDSGNRLREPVSGKPVSVIEEKVLEKEGIVMREEKCRAIPYHSVGKQHGILMGYEIPKMIVYRQHAKQNWNRVIIAVSKDSLFSDGKYQMLLSPAFLEKEEGD